MPSNKSEKPHHNEGWLREMYHEKGLTMEEVGSRAGVSSGTILYCMDKFGIERRGPAGSRDDACYKDEDWLRDHYVNKDLTAEETSEKAGCSMSTILNWLKKFEMGTRDVGGGDPNAVHKDPNWLYEMYHERNLDTHEIAELANSDPATIRHHMDNHGIERISNGPKVSEPHLKSYHGYEVLRHSYQGENHRVYHHRLLAVAKHGFNAVIDSDVHHRNHIKWDNRPENIELLSKSDHGGLHSHEYWGLEAEE